MTQGPRVTTPLLQTFFFAAASSFVDGARAEHKLDDRILKSGGEISPMTGRLCVGFPWFLFLCQRIDEAVMNEVASLGGSFWIHNQGGPAVFSPDQSRQLKHFVDVDNLGVLSPHQEVVEDGLDDVFEDETAWQCFLRSDITPLKVGGPVWMVNVSRLR